MHNGKENPRPHRRRSPRKSTAGRGWWRWRIRHATRCHARWRLGGGASGGTYGYGHLTCPPPAPPLVNRCVIYLFHYFRPFQVKIKASNVTKKATACNCPAKLVSSASSTLLTETDGFQLPVPVPCHLSPVLAAFLRHFRPAVLA
jgi:hypothetical protein